MTTGILLICMGLGMLTIASVLWECEKMRQRALASLRFGRHI